MINTADIQIRDPYIICDRKTAHYYMFGTTDKDCWQGPGVGFDGYVSRDLKTWEGPFAAFRPSSDFWGEENFWAPEVHAYQGKYYLFATFKGTRLRRGTAILVADDLGGPFVEHSVGAVTPNDWDCLDGTLYVDTQGDPWIVFCHEWTQVYDGEMCAARLSKDLKEMITTPVVLFKASESGWSQEYEWQGQKGFITDGPSFFTRDGKLCMLWSSFYQDEYAIGLAVSPSQSITGPWHHHRSPLYLGGGHCMVFDDLNDIPIVSFHQPNNSPDERAIFVDLKDIIDTIPLNTVD